MIYFLMLIAGYFVGLISAILFAFCRENPGGKDCGSCPWYPWNFTNPSEEENKRNGR